MYSNLLSASSTLSRASWNGRTVGQMLWLCFSCLTGSSNLIHPLPNFHRCAPGCALRPLPYQPSALRSLRHALTTDEISSQHCPVPFVRPTGIRLIDAFIQLALTPRRKTAADKLTENESAAILVNRCANAAILANQFASAHAQSSLNRVDATESEIRSTEQRFNRLPNLQLPGFNTLWSSTAAALRCEMLSSIPHDATRPLCSAPTVPARHSFSPPLRTATTSSFCRSCASDFDKMQTIGARSWLTIGFGHAPLQG